MPTATLPSPLVDGKNEPPKFLCDAGHSFRVAMHPAICPSVRQDRKERQVSRGRPPNTSSSPAPSAPALLSDPTKNPGHRAASPPGYGESLKWILPRFSPTDNRPPPPATAATADHRPNFWTKCRRPQRIRKDGSQCDADPRPANPDVAIEPQHFYREENAALWRVLSDLDSEHGQFDSAMVLDGLKAGDVLPGFEWAPYIAELMYLGGSANTMVYHAGKIRDAYVNRTIGEEALELFRDSRNGGISADELRGRFARLSALASDEHEPAESPGFTKLLTAPTSYRST